MQLKPGSELQNGKYRIIKTLGQGGFGITYLAEQTGLHRKVAIKEFFMKEYCERDDATSQVTLGTSRGSKDLVTRFRSKFVREAQMIAELEHPHIVKIYDVFEENGTAYYVMQFLAGESLSERVKSRGPLAEGEALEYIRQVGKALEYVHARKFLHFDVKPSNVLVNESGEAVLIDFGVSKHYDESGSQTSSTPVGISKGYAPMEQYQQNEISTFTPATDIYALGATLYTLLTGEIPPSASEVNEDGLPALPKTISKPTREAIEKAMQPRRKDRPQSVADFLSLLSAAPSPSSTASAASAHVSEETIFVGKKAPRTVPKPTSDNKKNKTWLWALLGALVIAAVALFLIMPKRLAVKADDNAFYACISADDYREYMDAYGEASLHYAEAQQFVNRFVEDSTKEAIAKLEEQKRLEAEARKKSVGDLIVFEGGDKGIVFYVDKTEEHGLVVSLDEAYGLFWTLSSKFPHEYWDDGTSGNKLIVGKGAKQTSNLIAALGSDAIAANWARKHGKDWYLPSNGEMFYMLRVANKWQETKGPVSLSLVNNGGTSLSSKRHDGYFTSSVYYIGQDGHGYLHRFDGDSMLCNSRDTDKLAYRAIRKF